MIRPCSSSIGRVRRTTRRATGLWRSARVLNSLRKSPRNHDYAAVLCAFDLIELEGEDLRRQPIERRKAVLADLLRDTRDGIAFNEQFEGDGRIVFEHACALGYEGIVSKRLGSPYRAGRVDHWLKIKNPAAPAVRRKAEEDWRYKRGACGRGKRAGQSMSVSNEQSSRTISADDGDRAGFSHRTVAGPCGEVADGRVLNWQLALWAFVVL
jgi:ATP-dependent DNA ligase